MKFTYLSFFVLCLFFHVMLVLGGNGNAPIITVLDVDCLGNGDGFVVIVEVTGGDPGEDGYQILFPISAFTGGVDAIGNPFILSGSTNEPNYIIQVMDADGDVVDVELAIQCLKCIPHLTGEMVPESLSLCGDGSLQGQITSTVIDEGTLYTYGLFENEVTDDSDVPLAISEDGTFSNTGLESGKTYYIVAFAGIDEDGDGWPDADDECREYKGSTEIVFFDAIEVDVSSMCDEEFQILYVTIESVTGGIGSNYTFNGEVISLPYTMSFGLDDDFEGGVIDDGTGNCPFTVAGIDNTCEPTVCLNDAGNFAGSDNEICGDDVFFTSEPTGSNVDAGSVSIYSLHTNPNDPFGSYVAIYYSPEFGVQEYGTTYYISHIVGPDDGSGIPVEGDDCTFIALGPNVTWYPEYSLIYDIVCQITPEGFYNGLADVVIGVDCQDCAENAEFFISGTHFNDYLTIGSSVALTMTELEAYVLTAEIVGYSPCPSSIVSGEVCCVKCLPIGLCYAKGEAQDKGNLIEWATYSETDNDYFILERSVNFIDFVNIHQQEGRGTVSRRTHYSFLDSNAPEGLSYYRITQFDYNGASESSNTFTLIRGEVSFVLTGVVPTVASTSVDINYHAALNSKVEMTIFDVSGKLISQSILASQTGANTETIDLNNYASGVYFVRLTDGINIAGERFIVK